MISIVRLSLVFSSNIKTCELLSKSESLDSTSCGFKFESDFKKTFVIGWLSLETKIVKSSRSS